MLRHTASVHRCASMRQMRQMRLVRRLRRLRRLRRDASFDLLTFQKVGSGLRMADFVYQNHRGNFVWNGQSMQKSKKNGNSSYEEEW